MLKAMKRDHFGQMKDGIGYNIEILSIHHFGFVLMSVNLVVAQK
jgi:hypothetical protein